MITSESPLLYVFELFFASRFGLGDRYGAAAASAATSVAVVVVVVQ